MPARLILAVATCLTLGACQGIGSRNVVPDRFNYNAAIGQSANEQLLINIVRLRYREVPVFLAVTSVLTQYVYTAGANISGAAGETTSASAGWTAGGGVNARYIERPTITYSPLTGQDFAQQLLEPVESDALFSLVQSGWPPEMLLYMALEDINDVRSSVPEQIPDEARLEELRQFRQVISMTIALTERHAMEMHRAAEEPHDRYLVFDPNADETVGELVDQYKELLGLDPGRDRFRVTERRLRQPDEVTIRARSLASLMGYVSRGVEVPGQHFDLGWALPMTRPDDVEILADMIPLRVHASTERPADAFAAVAYQGYWFYISNDDQQSKAAFGLLAYLYQIQAPAAEGIGPILTVPTG